MPGAHLYEISIEISRFDISNFELCLLEQNRRRDGKSQFWIYLDVNLVPLNRCVPGKDIKPHVGQLRETFKPTLYLKELYRHDSPYSNSCLTGRRSSHCILVS
jgi:hypothetical protein